MKYLKLYENFNDSDIHEICIKYGIENYTINKDGSIDVVGYVDLHKKGLTELPLNFRNIKGNFNCSYNQLTSLKGCPVSISHGFYCGNNELTSLEYCPEYVLGSFYCGNNELTSLEGCLKSVGDFNCDHNKLTSLRFMPSVKGSFNCDTNNIRDFIGFVKPRDYIFCDNNPIFEIWKLLFKDLSNIELLNEYDCIRGKDIVIDRLNQFLEEIDEEPVENIKGYNNI